MYTKITLLRPDSQTQTIGVIASLRCKSSNQTVVAALCYYR